MGGGGKRHGEGRREEFQSAKNIGRIFSRASQRSPKYIMFSTQGTAIQMQGNVGFRMKEPGIRYETVYADFPRSFGDNNLTRVRWRQVTLPQNSQQVTSAEWRRFRVELLSTLATGALPLSGEVGAGQDGVTRSLVE